MNKLILATGSDNSYLNKIISYLDSIEINSNFDLNFLIYLGYDDINLNYEKIKTLKISPSIIESPSQINCIQHGEFIKSDGFDELVAADDIVFFTDGDIILQRNLTEEELNKFRKFKDGDVFVGYNASPVDTLKNEFAKLSPVGFLPVKFGILPVKFRTDLSKIKIYNTGVLAMNKRTWKNLLIQYNRLFPDIDRLFRHYAKQQWLLSFIIGTMDFNIIEMSYEIHNHRHYPSPVGTRVDANNIVYYKDKLVLFKHKWN
jgi:hypothetical protein